jgi:adenylate cyclase
MRCTNCDTEASPGEDACLHCGQPLIVHCPACATPSRLDALFCGACGAYLVAAGAASPPRGSGDSERKHATAMFVDAVGSTGAVAGLDPEEAMVMLRPMLDAMRRAAEDFEGTVIRVTGDGILALFGAPRALEGHALLACRAAQATHAAMARLPTKPLVRIGLHSGDMVAAQLGSAALGDGAFGATLHLASRIEQLAPAATTYVSASTFELVRGHVDVRLVGARSVKGFDESVEVYELLALDTRPGAAPPAQGTRFVGRAREMAALERALENAREGKARVVGITALPGVGKSRLCREFSLRCRAARIRVLTMRALAYGHATPYQPVLELLRHWLHLSVHTPPEQARRRLRRALRSLAPQLLAHADLLADFLGIGDGASGAIDPEMRQNQLLGLVGDLVRLPTAKPLVIVVEDLHWLDAASERFVRRLVFSAPGTHTFVLLNFRPSYDASWMRGRNCSLLPLAELGEPATRAIVLQLMGGDARLKEMRERVAARSGGNPLFVDALVRSLRERGVLVGEPGDLRLGPQGGMPELPATIQSVLGARIDGPAEGDKPILQVASVVGLDFHLALLQPITGRTMAELETSMANLCAAGLVEPVSRREPVFAFRHPLIQEVAYSVQLKARRSAIHAEVAKALESFYGGRADEFAGLLAHHYEAAGQPLAATQYLVRAALWIGKTDSAQALRYWKHACELVRDAARSVSNDSLRILVNGQVVNYGWRVGMSLAEAKRYSLEAQHYARALGDRMTQTLLLAGYGRFVAALGSADAYVALVQEALALIVDSPEAGRIAVLKAQLAQAYRFAGRLRLALAANTQSLRKASRIGGFDIQMMGFRPRPWIMSIRATILVELGCFERARRWLDRVIALGSLEPVVQYVAHMGYVRLAWFEGDAALAREHAARVAAIAAASGIPYIQVYAHRCAGLARMVAGDFDGAIDELTRGLKLARRASAARDNEAMFLAEIADAHLRAGRDGEAIETATRATVLARRRRSRLAECHAWIVLGGAAARRGDAGAAQEGEAAFAAADALAAETGSVPLARLVERGRRLAGAVDP